MFGNKCSILPKDATVYAWLQMRKLWGHYYAIRQQHLVMYVKHRCDYWPGTLHLCGGCKDRLSPASTANIKVPMSMALKLILFWWAAQWATKLLMPGQMCYLWSFTQSTLWKQTLLFIFSLRATTTTKTVICSCVSKNSVAQGSNNVSLCSLCSSSENILNCSPVKLHSRVLHVDLHLFKEAGWAAQEAHSKCMQYKVHLAHRYERLAHEWAQKRT